MLANDTQSVYTDVQSMTQLRTQARNDPQATLEQVAKHFESLYMNMMLKSMRAASFGDPNFDSNNSAMYQDMYDSQIALQLSEQRGLGLAEMLVKQLQKGMPETNKEINNDNVSFNANIQYANIAVKSKKTDDPIKFNSKEEFVNTLMPYAEQAAEQLDVSPQILIAQAALETGWGQHMQRLPNGKSSYNLFNIKAGSAWSGAELNVKALEYKDGVAEKTQSSFRVYGSLQESFDDYVQFIKSNPRYQDALAVSNDPEAYARELQKAGYATDPSYAEKINNIFQRDIVSAPYSEYLHDA